MGFTLEVDNYRALRKVRWSPSGVCAITGPNASGKTTLLSSAAFLRSFLKRGLSYAVERFGGTASIKNQHSLQQGPIRLQISQGECRWGVRLVAAPPSFAAEETLEIHGEVVAEQSALSGNARVQHQLLPPSEDSILSNAMKLLQSDHRESLTNLHRLAASFRLYQNFNLKNLRTTGSSATAELELRSDGHNVFSVLRNWKAGRREHEERFAFVREGLRECFPETFDDLEFLVAGQTVTIQFLLRGLHEPIGAISASTGLLITLLHLCAVASTPDHGALAIDEPENGLHPFAIRTLLELMRSRAQAKGLTILLATHSPVVLNTFNTQPERVYIMEPGHDVLPVPLTEHSDPKWLAHFALGDLYSDQAFGAQQRPPA